MIIVAVIGFVIAFIVVSVLIGDGGLLLLGNPNSETTTTSSDSLKLCLAAARLECDNNWNSDCLRFGYGNGCTLPAYNASRWNDVYENQKDRCYVTFGQ